MAPLSRSPLAGYALLALVCLVVGGHWLARRSPAPAGATPVPVAPRAHVEVRTATRMAVVHVAGAVRRPGVYRLAAGLRVQDAVRRAGGPRRGANLDAINLAAPLQDGVQIVVPGRTAAAAVGAAGAGGATGAATPGAPVSLNTATEAQLETLDGVGPATAAKIIAYRREHGGFRSVADLTQVSGIGPKKLAALKGKVTT
jgi:competence protein ComEA